MRGCGGDGGEGASVVVVVIVAVVTVSGEVRWCHHCGWCHVCCVSFIICFVSVGGDNVRAVLVCVVLWYCEGRCCYVPCLALPDC